MKYVLFSLLILLSCKEKTKDAQIIEQLNAALLQKTADSIALSNFKAENSDQFRTYDSLKQINQITFERQNVHDSLIQKGVALAMKFVKDKMEVNDLQKKQ
jgi:hypothetical protein